MTVINKFLSFYPKCVLLDVRESRGRGSSGRGGAKRKGRGVLSNTGHGGEGLEKESSCSNTLDPALVSVAYLLIRFFYIVLHLFLEGFRNIFPY